MMRRPHSFVLQIVVVFGLFVLSLPSFAQVQLWKTTSASHDVVIEGYARTNNKCESIDPPTVYVDRPPMHGIVCSKNGELLLRKTVENDLSHRLSKRAQGIQVVYLPRKGYVGSDTVRYTVRFPTAQHAVEVLLTVLAGGLQSPGVAPPSIDDPASDVRQTPGPLPVCPALVSWR
jgi:hypothetical protein